MSRKNNKVYDEEVTMDSETKAYILACCRNHLVIYNDLIDYYRDNKTSTYKQIKNKLKEIMTNTPFVPFISSILNAEIYHMCKKADFKQKLITDIQYLSTISDGYVNNKVFSYKPEEKIIYVANAPGVITLSKELPLLDDPSQCIYMNLSYSGTTDVFELSVFVSNV